MGRNLGSTAFDTAWAQGPPSRIVVLGSSRFPTVNWRSIVSRFVSLFVSVVSSFSPDKRRTRPLGNARRDS